MLTEQTVDLAATPKSVLEGLAVAGKDLAAIARTATSSGDALLEDSGLSRLDEATQCHFGAHLGRSVGRGAITVFPLRWWNDKARSLTPGFIGELQVRPLSDQHTELRIVGEYYPRAYLYELVDTSFLGRMAEAVVATVLDRLGETAQALTSSPATVAPTA